MQDVRAETRDWLAQAAERGPGWRVFRWEDVERNQIAWRFRLLAPGEEPDSTGDVIRP